MSQEFVGIHLTIFDIKVASTTLNSYVKALKKIGYSDDKIDDEFDIKVIPKTIEAKNWTEWKNLIEGWTQEIGEE